MRVGFDLAKTLEENAAIYFEKAKKARSKLVGAKKAIERTELLLVKEKERTQVREAQQSLKKPEQHWYSKYRWTKTRNGHLVVAGQNAAANETLIKHHTKADTIVFHTDMAGSPFALILAEKDVLPEDLEDTAQFVVCYSKAWKAGMSTAEVFHVLAEQVTKEAQSGEYLPKGAFMIRGKTTYIHPAVELGLGVIEREGYQPEVFCGSIAACKVHCSGFLQIVPGQEKTSSIAKELRKRFGGDLDAYVKAIPAGGSQIVQEKKRRRK